MLKVVKVSRTINEKKKICKMPTEELISLGHNNVSQLCRYWMQRRLDAENHRFAEPKGLKDLCMRYLLSGQVAKNQAATDTMVVLAKMVDPAEKKPLLCDLRPKEHFAIGSEIVFYLSPYCPYYIVTDPARLFAGRIGTLLAGRVIDEHNFGIQSIVIKTDTPFRIREDNQLSGVTEVSIERPEVIRQDEYEYLRSHPEFLYQWAHYAQESHRSFDSSGFVKAVEEDV